MNHGNSVIDIYKHRYEGEEQYFVCSHFGCGKQLLLIESLAGSKCTQHMIEENIINDQINYFCLKTLKNKKP